MRTLSKEAFLRDHTGDRPHGPRFVITNTFLLPVKVRLYDNPHKVWHRGKYATRWVDLGSLWTEMQWENRLVDDPWVKRVGIRT